MTDPLPPIVMPLIEFTAPSINFACVMGKLSQAPVISRTRSGLPMATMLIQTTAWNPRANLNITDTHKAVAFGQSLVDIARYVSTGATVCVIGKMQTRRYTDAKGILRLTTEIVAESLQVARIGDGSKVQRGKIILAETPMEKGFDGKLVDLVQTDPRWNPDD